MTLSSLLHSVIVVVPAVLLGTRFSALAAFVFTKVPIRLGNVLFWVMLTIMFMPGIGRAQHHAVVCPRVRAPGRAPARVTRTRLARQFDVTK